MVRLLSSEKTEKPSKRKLTDARKKGQIFKSKDIIDNLTIIAALVSIKFFAPYIQNQYALFIQQLFSKNMLEVKVENMIKCFNISILFFLKITLPILFSILLVSLIANYAQTGILMSSQAIKFDLKKIDPIQGFKRIFSKKSLLEVIKFIVKFGVISFVISADIRENIQTTNTLVFFNANVSLSLMLDKLFSLILKIIMILFMFGFVDYFFQRKIYFNDMKMTKKEVKEEYKQSEGDPLLKGKIKEKQREISTNSMIKATSEATMLIANPTHIAVCIKYEVGMHAPIITAMARDHVAQKLKEIAKENSVPIIENKPLARALYNDGEIDHPVPTEHFRAIAEILVAILYSQPSNS